MILVINAGSTSVKVALFAAPGEDEAVWHTTLDAAALEDDRVGRIVDCLRSSPVSLGDVGAVGHRIVHGADRFDRPVIVDAAAEDAIAAIAELAPLHNQAGLDGIAAARAVLSSSVTHVAVFDTAFHRTIPAAAAVYGGPYEWYEQGLRRYGFHGISHEDAAHRAAALLGRPLGELRIVTCHLGGGCSVTAIRGGRSVDTTMGFTPLDGLIMATRAGSVDPGLLLHLLRTGAGIAELDATLEHGSGLLGLSGVSGDLRAVLSARDHGNERAGVAVDAFVHRVATGTGAMAAAMGGLDALVFTGGIGEHSPEIRARVTERLGFTGAAVEGNLNEAAPVDADVSPAGAAVRVIVIQAREEAAIAGVVRRLVTA